MKKVLIIEKIHKSAIKLLKNRKDFSFEVVENLESLEDEGDVYESIEEIWPDYPTEEDYLWNEDEY